MTTQEQANADIPSPNTGWDSPEYQAFLHDEREAKFKGWFDTQTSMFPRPRSFWHGPWERHWFWGLWGWERQRWAEFINECCWNEWRRKP